ncbi:MAG: nucleotidyltransferase [Firmicutes bacterium]|nr:nucleotidyltransferase [Bacillota bacterium]
MLVTGVIAEYNPFHKGHRYHLEEARRLTGADLIVCVLSGNFTQRGEPAIVNKWARTKMALAEGADIVLELPLVYASQHAQGFASGAVQLLQATGVVEYLVFGSEHGKIKELESLACFLLQEGDFFQKKLKTYLNTGLPFPAARASSLMDYQYARGIPGLEHLSAEELYSLVRHPNNILGLEYLQAILRLKSGIQPLTISRLSSGYHDKRLKGSTIASATAIRLALRAYNWRTKLSGVIPPKSWDLLKQEIDAGRAPIFINAFESQIISLIRRTPLPALRQIDGIREGLENRLKRAARSCGSIECLLAKMKTKRYTQTHLQRLLLHLLLGMKKEDAINFAPQTKPCYLRLLGFSPSGKKLLQTIKKKACLPLVTRPARELPAIIRHSSRAARMWDLESLATDLYVLAYPCHSARKAGQDYTNPLIITK